MSSDSFEVAVVGAGPAGATAAALLAQKQHSVVLVDRAPFPRDAGSMGWLNAQALPLLAEMGAKDKPLRSGAFRDVTFHNADFTKTAHPTFEDAAGYLIDRTRFADVLVKTAVDHGATLVSGCGVVDARLKEPGAILKLADGREVQGRLLLLAAGWRSPLLQRIDPAQSSTDARYFTAQVDAPADGSGRAKPRVGVVLGLDNGGSFALYSVWKGGVSVGVHWAGEREKVAGELAAVCRLAFDHKVVPVDLTAQAAQAKVVASPAGAALDMDSHLGKHTLIIGDAGGFVAATSNEGIYPAMWAAQIAAEVVHASLDAVHPQDELMKFDTAWRTQLADYLRPPQTDIQFLLPLIFSNQPMADRMGAAFFRGESI